LIDEPKQKLGIEQLH